MNLIPEKTKHMNETNMTKPNIELIHTDELTAHPTNSKIHSPAKIEAVANAIEEFGFTAPVLIDENNVILAGHCRVTAAQTIDFPSVPCVRLTHLTETQKNAYVIADNRLAEFGSEWDESMLAAELAKLETEGFDIDLLGFDEGEISRLTADLKPPETDEDEVPEVPAVPVTVAGDVWLCGNHRVMCGDSTSAEEVGALMDGKKADMVFTDPPYNVAFTGQELSNTTKGGKKVLHHKGENTKHELIANDCMEDEDFNEFITKVILLIKEHNRGAWYFCFCDLKLDLILTPLKKCGLIWKSVIIWSKNQATLSGKDYKSRYEPIVYGSPSGSFYGERYKQEDIWEFQRTLKNDLHPTMKPIPLIENAINNSSKSGMTVLDLFLGSGSTLIACEKTARKCYGMELDPKYCDVIVQRWQDYTGQEATHAVTGETFNDTANG